MSRIATPSLRAIRSGRLQSCWPGSNAERLIFTPGRDWAYSNVGYIFVRQLIEEKAGLEIGEALRMLVFDPMDIQHTQNRGNAR